jgi:hypothetical protein
MVDVSRALPGRAPVGTRCSDRQLEPLRLRRRLGTGRTQASGRQVRNGGLQLRVVQTQMLGQVPAKLIEYAEAHLTITDD